MSSAVSVLWRVLISALAVSYLICVLFLSGLQKEDMDVSLLRKLHRYNLNIEDINNEKLQKNCINPDLTSLTNNQDSYTIKYPYKVFNVNFENSSKEIKLTTSTKNDAADNINLIKYTNGQPTLETLMKLWKNYIKPSEKASTTEIYKIITRRATDLKTEMLNKLQFSVDLNDTEFINKIFLDRFSKPSQREQTHINFKPTENIFENNYQLNTENIVVRNSYDLLSLNKHINMPRGQINSENNMLLKTKNENEKKLDDILKSINQFKTMFSNMTPDQSRQTFKDSITTHSSNLKVIQHETKSDDQSRPFALQPAMTEDLVQKIAQSVKDMILHDLRKEAQITTTTQRVEVISISNKNPLTNQENIMDKFMNIFKNLKINQSSLKVNSNELKNSNSKQAYHDNGNKFYDRPSKQIEAYNIYPKQPYNLPPQIHKYKTDAPNNLKNKIISKPITFQTNSLEIPPLGIPITHQFNPINQNIIVTTVLPFKMNYEVDHGQTYSDDALMKVYPKELMQSPLSAKFSKRSDDCPLDHPCDHKNEDIIRFRLSNDGKAKYDTDYYEKINLGRIQPSLNNNGEKLFGNTPRFHEKLERVDDRHEIFSENTNGDCCNSKYAMSQQMIECCNEKIASRQQMSITNMKRGSYDDTHFRNFLKTQQKVTDMLEKILATKTRSNLPRSVEMT